MRTATFITLGCKINQYDTEAVREELLSLGYQEAPAGSPADLTVVNTCSVTAEGFAKSRRAVLRAARANPQGRIVVVGCSTVRERDSLASIPQVALAGGNEHKLVVGRFVTGQWSPGDPLPDLRPDGPWDLRISRFRDRTRACVKVQDGCNGFCSFCIIPFLRGRSRSRPPEEVMEEVRRLVRNGYREIVLTGVHIQDYRFPAQGPKARGSRPAERTRRAASLADLVRAVAGTPGLLRLRLSSMGVRAFTPQLLDALSLPAVCRHWHVPLQAGSDAVLEAMRRDYRVADFRRALSDLKQRFQEPAISTDVIVGYPGETEADFEATLSACREFAFSKIHVFPYSRREGTLASKLGGDVDPREIRRRARVLGELERDLGLQAGKRLLGKTVEVLVEGRVRHPRGSGDGELEGFTERYVRVRFPAPRDAGVPRLRGTVQHVEITSVTPEEGVRGKMRGDAPPRTSGGTRSCRNSVAPPAS